MKYLFILLCILFFNSCTTNNNSIKNIDNRIALKTDTINLIKLSDTMVIYESACRGCKYEASTSFSIADSMNIVKLISIKTIDNNPSGIAGGNVSKELELVPAKSGKTIFKLYKFLQDEVTPKDSANFIQYKIEVK